MSKMAVCPCACVFRIQVLVSICGKKLITHKLVGANIIIITKKLTAYMCHSALLVAETG